MFKPLTAALAALAFSASIAAPIATMAQDLPSYAQGSDDAQIRGRIASFDGAYALSVRDDQGYLDNVQLHEGTIINPTGLTLAPGMVVSILGYNQGPYFSANEIDTPYTYDGGVPYYAGHPWDYYGPSFGLTFFFGNPGWWHGNYFHGGYRYYGGTRVYNSVVVHNVYHSNVPGGGFRGRTFVAPREAGGYHAGGGGYHGGGGGGGGESHGHR
jgi:hypothetical protein